MREHGDTGEGTVGDAIAWICGTTKNTKFAKRETPFQREWGFVFSVFFVA